MTNKFIYFDNAATTRVDPRVVEKMLPYLSEDYGNPSSIHSFGNKAKVAVEDSRELVAKLINADPSEIYFTSGGTEANNLALQGIYNSQRLETGKTGILISNTEHHSILDTAGYLGENDAELKTVPVTNDGIIDPKSFSNYLNKNTALTSIIFANNEIGTINQIQELAKITKSFNSYFHTDAVQALGKIKIDVKKLGVDSLSASAHKIKGPKGSGFIYIKNGTPFMPLFHGGSQERNRRGGTQNVAGIVGFAEALKIFIEEQSDKSNKVKSIKTHFINNLRTLFGNKVLVNSPFEYSSDFILSITFSSKYFNNDPEAIFMYLDVNGIAASNGAACSSGTVKPSHVIKALGYNGEDAKGTIRFSFNDKNSIEEVNFVIKTLEKLANQIKKD